MSLPKDLEKRAIYLERLRTARKGKPAWNKGKTNTELFGEEKASELSAKLAEAQKGNRNHLGHTHSEESKLKNRLAHLGRPSANKGNPTGYKHSQETKDKIAISVRGRMYPERKGRSYEELFGDMKTLSIKAKQSISLKNESTAIFTQIGRGTLKYKAWLLDVLTRDGYKCTKCGSTENLHAHHIKNWNDFPSLRYDVSNGLTLCASCHRKEECRTKT